MGRTARFQEADVKRAMSAAHKLKVRDYRVDIRPDGTISLVVGTAARQPAGSNSCDDLLD